MKLDELPPEAQRAAVDWATPWDQWVARFMADLNPGAAPWFHRHLWEHVWTPPTTTPTPVLAVWFRGAAKSTITRRVAIGLGATRRRSFALWVSGTQDAADRHVTSATTNLSHELLRVYPWLTQRSETALKVTQGLRQSMVSVGNRFTLLGVGLNTRTRGVTIGEQRPDLIVFDDLDERTDSPRVTQKKFRVLTEEVLPTAQHAGALVVGAQNLIHPTSVFTRLVAGEALTNACVIGPVPMVRNPVFDGGRLVAGEPTWPEVVPITAAQRAIDNWGIDAWWREGQHELTRTVPGALIPYNAWASWTPDTTPDRVVVAVDPSVSSSTGSDATGIVVVGVWSGGRVGVLEDATTEPATPMETWCSTVVRLCQRYGTRDIVAEANQGGDAWRVILERAGRDVGHPVRVQLATAREAKADRARPVADLVQRGDVVLAGAGDFHPLRSEWSTWLPGDPSPNRIDALVWGVRAANPEAHRGERPRTSGPGFIPTVR